MLITLVLITFGFDDVWCSRLLVFMTFDVDDFLVEMTFGVEGGRLRGMQTERGITWSDHTSGYGTAQAK